MTIGDLSNKAKRQSICIYSSLIDCNLWNLMGKIVHKNGEKAILIDIVRGNTKGSGSSRSTRIDFFLLGHHRLYIPALIAGYKH